MTGYERLKKSFQGQRILIMGLGVLGGGSDTVRFFQSLGCPVTITDLRSADELAPSLKNLELSGIKTTFGRHDPKDFKDCEVIIRNPGVPQDSQFLLEARQLGKPIYLETALFAKYTASSIIGITGTRGKSTTTHLIHQVLSGLFKQPVALGGNLPGISTISLLQHETSKTAWTILELSSWQLQGFADFKISPHLAVFTNLYPDHLNRYKNMAEYLKDKSAITAYQTQSDYFFYNRHDQAGIKLAQNTQAQTIAYGPEDIDNSFQLSLPGEHNRANAAAALAVAKVLSLPIDQVKTILGRQKSLEFRLETIRTLKGVTYINDTTSTTPIALITAIKSLDRPATVIVGGQAKNLPTDEMIETLNFHPMVKSILLIPGSGTSEISGQLDRSKIAANCDNLDEAVAKASEITPAGHCVLFSPGFTSFAQYQNEFHRGRHFNQLVQNLK